MFAQKTLDGMDSNVSLVVGDKFGTYTKAVNALLEDSSKATNARLLTNQDVN